MRQAIVKEYLAPFRELRFGDQKSTFQAGEPTHGAMETGSPVSDQTPEKTRYERGWREGGERSKTEEKLDNGFEG